MTDTQDIGYFFNNSSILKFKVNGKILPYNYSEISILYQHCSEHSIFLKHGLKKYVEQDYINLVLVLPEPLFIFKIITITVEQIKCKPFILDEINRLFDTSTYIDKFIVKYLLDFQE